MTVLQASFVDKWTGGNDYRSGQCVKNDIRMSQTRSRLHCRSLCFRTFLAGISRRQALSWLVDVRGGSIGVVGTYYNAKEALKKEGIDYREIYPDSADLKNREHREIAENK